MVHGRLQIGALPGILHSIKIEEEISKTPKKKLTCSIQRCIKLALFLIKYTRLALKQLCFTQPMTNIMKSRMEKPPKFGVCQQKPTSYHYRNIVIHGHNLRIYPRLLMNSYARKIAGPTARPKVPLQTSLRNVK